MIDFKGEIDKLEYKQLNQVDEIGEKVDLYQVIEAVMDKMSKADTTNKKLFLSVESFKNDLSEMMDTNEIHEQQLKKFVQEQDQMGKKIMHVLDELDNLYRYAVQSQNEGLITNMNQMMKLIRKHLMESGFEEIPCVGEIFNAEVHECVDAVERTDKVQHEIVDVVKKGYRLKGKILRVAAVIAVK